MIILLGYQNDLQSISTFLFLEYKNGIYDDAGVTFLFQKIFKLQPANQNLFLFRLLF